jgi:hypothetical protein
MSTLEDRLRDAFRADADLVRPDSIPAAPPPRPAPNAPGRPGSSRTRVLIPLAAAAAVVAIVTGLSLAAPQRGGSRPTTGSSSPSPGPAFTASPRPQPPPPTGPPPKPTLAANASRGVPASAPAPGVPPFYVTEYVAPSDETDYVVVHDTATGKVTGQINPEGGTVFAGAAATSGDRTFITALESGNDCSPVQLYQFQLNQRGVPGPLEPLHIAVPGGVPQGEGGLAITPDGRTIAYESAVCSNSTVDEYEVGVINLATRQARVWTDLLAFATGEWPSMDLSLSTDGGLLSYAGFDGTGVLPTSAPAGSLFARSRLVSRNVIWAAVAGDGDALYGCAVSPARRGWPIPSVGTLSYIRISLTGGGNQVIASRPDMTSPQCSASLDAAGNYLLVQFPTTAHGVDDWARFAFLNLRTGKVTNINAPALDDWSRPVIGELHNINVPLFYGPFDIAW